MKRRTLAGLALALAFSAQLGTVLAQDPPVMKSSRIVDALSKDVRVDGGPAGNSGRRAQPAVDLQVQFGFDSADLLPAGRRQLDELAHALSTPALAREMFQITGHTDRVGDADYNLRLSRERAAMVRNYLVTTHGISPGRLQSAGLGFAQLADPANPAAAVNRRVEVRRLALAGPSMPHSPTPSPAGGGRLVPTPQ